MKKLRLLSTDFDGTLIGLAGQGKCIPVLADALEAVHSVGAVWVVNTGRSLEFTLAGLRQFGAPWTPDFLAVNERHVFGRVGNDWHGLGNWNETCDITHENLFARCHGLLREIRSWVAGMPGVDLLPDDNNPEGIITVDEPTMNLVVKFLDHAALPYEDFSWQRNTVYLRFCHSAYHKGAALGHLARELGLRPCEILAAGDHHNDLSMLQPAVAEMLVCPGNAVAEVQKAVTVAKGFSSQHPFGHGTAEGIFHYLDTCGMKVSYPA